MKTFSVDALQVRLYDSLERMAQGAATDVADTLRSILVERGHAAMILASAASQVAFLDDLVVAKDVDWSRITLFHMDEYLGISPEHPASFRRFIRERVVVRVHPRAFHELRGEADEPMAECERYAALLKATSIDVCCLGIGENGHVAFNDPPVADFEDARAVKLVKLDEACRHQQVGEGAFPDLESVPAFAYTLTVPTLCAARSMFCIVPERRKAEAVLRALTGPIEPACPASVLRRQDHARLYLDPDSARLWLDARGQSSG